MISRTVRSLGIVIAITLVGTAFSPLPAQTPPSVEVTYLWHLHQPIYWPAPAQADTRRYEFARDTVLAQNGGRGNPSDTVSSIFGLDDRIAAYQYRPKDSIQTLFGQSLGGVQINYSGSLMQNVASLGENSMLGYTPGWKNAYAEALGWTTSPTGKPRMDIVNFGAHHGLLPLLTRRTVEMELAVHKEALKRVWGDNGIRSRGFFPTETCFSVRLIPSLVAAGYAWTFVSNTHLSRACGNFPLVLGDGGENCDPPNRADQINPEQSYWWRMKISRGCSPANAAPFAALPHWAQFVNPETGAISRIQVIPTDQALSWIDGYQCFGVNNLDGILGGPASPDGRPPLVVLSHDGDNAFGGGYSYYMECVPQLANSIGGKGGIMSTVENYLARYTTPETSLVHVEDGGWVNADSDFGSPTFINWNYPLLTRDGQIDPVNGWHEKVREQAIFLAIENALRTLEDTGTQSLRVGEVLQPTAASTPLERGWHFYLGAIDSGNVYYGTPGDMEVRGTIGCNAAWDQIISSLGGIVDRTGPSIFPPQRHPYNPGEINFGVQYGYKTYHAPSDFTVWTFVYDVSNVTSATLYYRVDKDGRNPLDSIQNETFAGGDEVGSWQAVPMSIREFPQGDPYGRPEINYFVLPANIANHASATITGQKNVLLDYYVAATDSAGNRSYSDLQHVWVGEGPAVPTPTATATPSPTPGPNTPPWSLDGQLDPGLTPIAVNGSWSLYAARHGDWLYVATTAPTSGGPDRFILIARQPGAMKAAPWAKSGQVATWDHYLALEGSNGWNGWFDSEGTQPITGSNFACAATQGAILEGYMNMQAAWGSVPAKVYLCAAGYETQDGGALRSGEQVPVALNPDANIQANEYLEFPFAGPSRWILH